MSDKNRKMGIEGKLYYGVAGSTPGDTEVHCRDLSYTIEPTRAEVNSRASIIELSRVAMIKVGLEWEMNNDVDDATLTALKAAAVAGTLVALKTCDYASGWGMDADFNLSMSKAEPLQDAQRVRFTAEPDPSAGRVPSFA